MEAVTQRQTRTQRGHPHKLELPQDTVCYRLRGAVEAHVPSADTHGWTVLAITVGAEICTDAELLHAYQTQHTSVEPDLRWIKNPAASSPMWLEQPERITASATLTVVGVLVYAVIRRQVRLYLRAHVQHVPGNKGPTATPTAAVVFTLFAPIMPVQFAVDEQISYQVHGLQPHHLLLCEAVGIDPAWYWVPPIRQNSPPRIIPS